MPPNGVPVPPAVPVKPRGEPRVMPHIKDLQTMAEGRIQELDSSTTVSRFSS